MTTPIEVQNKDMAFIDTLIAAARKMGLVAELGMIQAGQTRLGWAIEVSIRLDDESGENPDKQAALKAIIAAHCKDDKRFGHKKGSRK